MISTLEITLILFQDYIKIILFLEHWKKLAILMKFTHISITLCLGINQNLLFPEIKNIEQNDIEKSRRKSPNYQPFRTINIFQRLNLRMNHPPNCLGMISHKMSITTIFLVKITTFDNVLQGGPFHLFILWAAGMPIIQAYKP